MALTYKFINIENYGSLALSERPKLKEIKSLTRVGCTKVVTILGSRGEQALRIGNEVQSSGMTWEWVKVKNAVKMEPSEKLLFKKSVKNVADSVKNEETILVHCSAGLHRTGIFAYCLLSQFGLSNDEIMQYIKQIRLETYEAFEEKYQDIAKELTRI